MEIIKWLVTSSADPTKYSAMVKGTLGLGVAYVIQLSALTCGYAIFCVDPSLLQSVVQTIGNIVYFGLSLISAVVFLYGLGRKVWLNRFSAYPLAPAKLPQ